MGLDTSSRDVDARAGNGERDRKMMGSQRIENGYIKNRKGIELRIEKV